MPNRGEVVVRIAPVVGELQLRVHVESIGVWVATLVHEPACTAEGKNKLDAITNAVKLYLHLLIMRMNRNQWQPQLRKAEQREDDL